MRKVITLPPAPSARAAALNIVREAARKNKGKPGATRKAKQPGGIHATPRH